jgi:hypothetical protein
VIRIAWPLLLLGCLPHFDTSTCHAPEECPPRFACIDRTCVPQDAAVMPDMAVVDAAVVDAAPPERLAGAAVDERFGFEMAALRDVNGDGFEDLAVGAPYLTSETCPRQCGRVYVFLGRPGGYAPIPHAVIDGPEVSTRRFGIGFASPTPDFNGDGIGDLAVATREGPLYIVYGTVDGIPSGRVDRIADRIIERIPELLNASFKVRAPDLNGDDRSDLVLVGFSSVERRACFRGSEIFGAHAALRVFISDASGVPEALAQRIDDRLEAEDFCDCPGAGSLNCFMGDSHVIADVTGDGLLDIVTGAAGLDEGAGQLRLHRGGADGFAPAEPWISGCPNEVLGRGVGTRLGMHVIADVTGDGRPEVMAFNNERRAPCDIETAGHAVRIISTGEDAGRTVALIESPTAHLSGFRPVGDAQGVLGVVLLDELFADVDGARIGRIWWSAFDGTTFAPPEVLLTGTLDQPLGSNLLVTRPDPAGDFLVLYQRANGGVFQLDTLPLTARTASSTE